MLQYRSGLPLTPAAAQLIAVEPTRAGVGGGDEREPGWELHGSGGTGDHHAAIFERLAQAFERVQAELGELIQEEHAVMHERALMYLERAQIGSVVDLDGADRRLRETVATAAGDRTSFGHTA